MFYIFVEAMLRVLRPLQDRPSTWYTHNIILYIILHCKFIVSFTLHVYVCMCIYIYIYT